MCFARYYHPATILFLPPPPPPQLKIMYETLITVPQLLHFATTSYGGILHITKCIHSASNGRCVRPENRGSRYMYHQLILGPRTRQVSGTYSTRAKQRRLLVHVWGICLGMRRFHTHHRRHFVDGFAGGLGAIQITKFLRTCLWSCS